MTNGFILNNKILDVVLVSTLLAQVYKCFSPLFTERKIKLYRIFETGGMPSSHSSSTTALCTCIGILEGINSVNFSIAVILSCVVMYDATGIRREAGKHAKTLNKILRGKDYLKTEEIKDLKEFLGHSPLEVLIGAILGIAIAFAFKGYLIS